MRLLSFRVRGQERWGVALADGVIDATALYPSLRAALQADGLAEVARRFAAGKPDHPYESIEFLPVIPDPGKILCVGLNYVEHVHETGREVNEKPTFFLRVAESQVGHDQPMLLPAESTQLDYEGEIAIVIGRAGRRIDPAKAWDYVAGYSCYNDGSVRDYQRHTTQWTAGKNFFRTAGFGPWMVTTDEVPAGALLTLRTRLNGELMQQARTDMLIHDIPSQIAFASTFTPLAPGDVIVTGTPGGVGSRRNPPIWMKPGDVVEVEVERIGVLRNRIQAEAA